MNSEQVKKSCLTCRHKDVCLQRGLAIFMLYIETGRHEEVEKAKDNLDISGQCSNYDAAKAEAQTDTDEG